MTDSIPTSCTRRDFLHRAAHVGATLAAGLTVTTPSRAEALNASRHAPSRLATPTMRRPDSPAEALAALYAGNARFASGRPTAPHRSPERLRDVAAQQHPFAAVLGCADSRVPVEIVFDQGFGDIFVTRIAGNVADPAIIGSLEFGTEVLGAQVLYVLGHSGCGAVSATMSGREVPGQISTLYQHIRRATRDAHGDLPTAIARNVEIQAEILSEASPVIARRLAAGQLVLAGGVYDLSTGRVTAVQLPTR